MLDNASDAAPHSLVRADALEVDLLIRGANHEAAAVETARGQLYNRSDQSAASEVQRS